MWTHVFAISNFSLPLGSSAARAAISEIFLSNVEAWMGLRIAVIGYYVPSILPRGHL